MKKFKLIIIILSILAILLGSLIILKSLFSDEKKVIDENNESISELEKFDRDFYRNLAALLEIVNDVNKVLNTNSIDREQNLKIKDDIFYKYIGENEEDIINMLDTVYSVVNYEGGYFHIDSENGRDKLYIRAGLNQVYEINIVDASLVYSEKDKKIIQIGNSTFGMNNSRGHWIFDLPVVVFKEDIDKIHNID